MLSNISYFFLLLNARLRGEVDPRESLPLKSPFLTALVFRYIVRLAFASVKHNVLVRVHVVLPGRHEYSSLCRRPLFGEGPPVASGINHHLAGTLWYIPPPLESGINHHLAKAPKTSEKPLKHYF